MSLEGIKEGLEKYKKKHYFKKLSKGLLITLTFSIASFFAINGLESFFWFDSTVRFLFFVLLLLTFLIPSYFLIVLPVLELFKLKKGLSNKQMAIEIGKFFPNVDDRLINLLELNDLSCHNQSLIAASIQQKEQRLSVVDFSKAINLKVNLKYLYGFLAILICLALFSFIRPFSISDSTARIIRFQEEFEKPMPFSITIENDQSFAFKNEDFTLNLLVTGDKLPSTLLLHLDNDRKVKPQSADNQNYSYTFNNLQESFKFRIEGAGFFTKQKEIEVISRPEISDFNLSLDYPAYTKMVDEKLKNLGNAIIPEGTKITWGLKTTNVDSARINLGGITHNFERTEDQFFTYSRIIKSSENYSVDLTNGYGQNKRPINYTLEVIKDQFPEISVEFLPDTTLYSSLIIAGKLSDDYGFSRLEVVQKGLPNGKLSTQQIKFNKELPEQGFVHRWEPNSIDMSQFESFEVWVSVWDNDGVNGPKQSISDKFYFKKPNKEEISKLLYENSNQTEKQIDRAENQSEKLNKQIDELENRLKNKKELGWQEQKMLKDIISKKEEIQKSIEEIQNKHEELMAAQNQFDKPSEKLVEKSQQLQKLMDELLDDETKALYDELKKLLEEKRSLDEVSEQLSKIKPSEKSLEKELERALELFKKLKLETKIESTAKELEKLGEKQEKLADEKTDMNENNGQTQKKQEEISKEFDEIKKDISEIEQLNQDLKSPQPLEDFNKDEQDIQEKLDELSEDMKSAPSKKSQQKQKNTGDKMKQMAQKMKNMQSSSEMVMMEENIEQLLDILDNLIKTSFEQERIITDFREVSQSDPRFLELSQDQLTLVDNSKVIEDSLLSLASRVIQISNFITREISQINRSLDGALDAIKERQKSKATTHQQFAMTSMNNLALLLDDVLQQMQMAMSEAMGNPKPGGKPKPSPGMSELQQQLSEQIQDLKKSGKSGRPLSEELAKLAAEQARIREQLEALQQKLAGQNDNGESGGNGLKEAIEKMEQNEVDLVNKQLTQNLINRQQEIISRMLEAEKSMREQDQDPEREGESAKKINRKQPPAFEDYLNARKKEIELLNTIPLDLNPFYKKEVNDYFRRLSVQEK